MINNFMFNSLINNINQSFTSVDVNNQQNDELHDNFINVKQQLNKMMSDFINRL